MTVAGVRNYAPSTLLSVLDSNRLPLLPFSLAQSAGQDFDKQKDFKVDTAAFFV